MKENHNASCVYYITSPDGQNYSNVLDLKQFCKEHNLIYKNASEQSKINRPYKGWIIERIKKSLTEDKQLESFGLSVEERYQKILDDNNKLRLQIKEIKRESTLFKMLSGIIKENIRPIITVPYIKTDEKKAKINESAILMLSDIHGDQEIKPERVQNLENFNFDVACKRAERIVGTTISHLVDNMTNYNFEKLYIFGLGDYVSGQIHGATEHSKWKNSIKNAMAVGELVSLMILDLAKYFPQIVFVSISGNHGRFTNKKDYRGAHSNWDYLVGSYCIQRLENLIKENRLTYAIPDSWTAGIKIYDWNFVLNHGDDIKSWNSIPFYGIQRKVMKLSAVYTLNGIIPHYFMYGHFHNYASQVNVTGETFINGNFAATDEYALESLGAFSEPVQMLLGVHEKYGVTWRMPIRLRTNNWQLDEKIKSRYDIKLIGD